MLRHLRQIITNNLPLQFTLSYGALLSAGLIAVTLACAVRTESAIEQTQQQLGESSAKQLAQLAVPAVAERDHLSLQAMLARATNEPVVSAAIFDVENNLLAQAGTPPSQQQSQRLTQTFTAPIGLGDNITGNVSITLDITDSSATAAAMRNWLWIAALLLLAGIGALSWRFGRSLREQRAAASRALLAMAPTELSAPYQQSHTLSEAQLRALLLDIRHHVDRVSSPTPEQIQQAARNIVDCREGRLYLLLACKNLELLKKQVSREPLAQLLAHTEQIISQFAKDNNLTSLPVAGSYLKLALPAISRDQLPSAVVQARALSEQLLAELATQKSEAFGIRLNWAAALDWHPPAASEFSRNQQLAQDHQRSEWLCIEAGRFELVLSVEAGSWLKDSELELVHSESGLPFYRKVTEAIETTEDSSAQADAAGVSTDNIPTLAEQVAETTA